MAFGVEVICHLGKITIIRKMAWLFFWQWWRKRTDFSAYKDKSLRNLKRFRGCCLTGKNIACEPLGSVENQTLFLKCQNHKSGGGEIIKNIKPERKEYSFLLGFETELIKNSVFYCTVNFIYRSWQEAQIWGWEGKVWIFSDKMWKMVSREHCLTAMCVLTANNMIIL